MQGIITFLGQIIYTQDSIHKGTIQTCASTSLFPGTYDWYTQGFPLCHSLSGQYHYI